MKNFKIHVNILHILSIAKVSNFRTNTMATTIKNDEDEKIRLKFENYDYSLRFVPQVLGMSVEGVFVDNNAPYSHSTNLIKFIEQRKQPGRQPKKNRVQTNKLKAKGSGDWSLGVCTVKRSFFRSREAFENITLSQDLRDYNDLCDILFAKISIREAMERMFVECSCDMDYYLTHRSELEVDLGRQLATDFDPSDVKVVKKLEQELFYVNMCKIFGQENDDDLVEVDNVGALYNKSFMLRDFRFLSYDGNDMYAIAIRDSFYLLFYFSCS